MQSLSIFLVAVVVSACAHAVPSHLIRGKTGETVTLADSLAEVKPGSIVVIGENHGFKAHQEQQVEIMQTLRNQGLKVSVGMEFFTYTQQNLVEQYHQGSLAETDFLSAIQWGSIPFDLYRDQTLFPSVEEGSKTIALNAPRSLTGKISKTGLTSLSPQELALMPPQFSVGRDSYKERFLAMMPHLPNPEAGERYFAAQSTWDDTMAWQATNFISSHPDQVLVIVVGEFHVQYGGGLPDRLAVRAPTGTPILTFSQFNTLDLTQEEVDQEVLPSPKYGPRADYIWLAPAQ
ncbi:hypothetical protein D3C87_123730 [compost metagenome]